MPITFQHKPGLVAYVTCGDPDLRATTDVILAAIDAGADVIELGVPFSDPIADGPIIQQASQRALSHGTSLKDVLAIARTVRDRSTAGLIVFSYLNPVLKFGLERFCAAAADAGVDGALITDLPTDEASDYLRCMTARNLAPVFLAAPTSTDARLRAIAKLSTGFIYAVSRAGVTGTRDELTNDAESLVKRIRRVSKLPVAVGFGVSNAEQFASVGKFADAAVVGSAIVKTIEQNPGREAQSVREFVAGLRKHSRSTGATR